MSKEEKYNWDGPLNRNVGDSHIKGVEEAENKVMGLPRVKTDMKNGKPVYAFETVDKLTDDPAATGFRHRVKYSDGNKTIVASWYLIDESNMNRRSMAVQNVIVKGP